MSFPADPNTSALFDLLMQDGRYGSLLIGADNRILGVMGAAAHMLGHAAEALLGRTLDSIGRQLPGSAGPGAILGMFVSSGPGGEPCTLGCQRLAAAEPGQWLLVLRADPPDAVADSAPSWPAAEAFFQYLNQSAHVALWISDPALRQLHYLSPGARKLWGPGWDIAASPDIWRDAILTEDMPRLDAFIQTQMGGKAAEVEVRIRRRDGTIRWLWAHSCPWIYTRGQPCVTGVIADVTGTRSELRTAGAPQHWDALLREGHHRVKNSLQGLAALLHRQASTRGAHREILIEAVGQVRAIAAVHDLYSREGQSVASLGELLKNLVDSVEGLYPNHPPIERAWTAPADSTPVPSNQILPLAVIINELLTNALKHGHPAPGAQAAIRIHLHRDGEAVALAIDNPGRLPPGFDFARKRGLGTGLQLIAALLDPPHIALEIRPLTHATLRATLRLAASHEP